MRIVIEGAGEIGSHLAKMLSREANEITVLDSDKGRLARLASVAERLLLVLSFLPRV